MIVCVCHSVSDKKIRELVMEKGVESLKEIKQCTKLGTQCGKCVHLAKAVIDESLAIQYLEVS